MRELGASKSLSARTCNLKRCIPSGVRIVIICVPLFALDKRTPDGVAEELLDKMQLRSANAKHDLNLNALFQNLARMLDRL